MKKIIAFAFVLLISEAVFAQDIETGIYGGGAYYLGDINPGKQFTMVKPSYGLIARYNLDTRWTVRLNVLRGTLSSDDKVIKYKKDRLAKFNADVTEVSAQMEVNFLDYFTGSYKTYISPYMFAGMGFFSSKYANSFCVPFGIGVKYSLTPKIGLGAEWGLRKTYTDYIDGMAATYSDTDKRQYSDSQTNDWYSFAGITLTYKIEIGSRPRCLNSVKPYKKHK